MPRGQGLGGYRGQPTLFWYGPKLQAHYAKVMRQRLEDALVYLRARVGWNITKPFPPPSRPGQFPHKRTGRLQRELYYELDRRHLVGRLVSGAPYGLYLERGVKGGKLIFPKKAKMLSWIDWKTGERRFAKFVRQGAILKRSFLRRTLIKEMPALQRRFFRPIPDMPGGKVRTGAKR